MSAPSKKQRKEAAAACSLSPAPPSAPSNPSTPAKPTCVQLDITFRFRPEDKYIGVKFHYAGDYHAFVRRDDCDKVLTVFTALGHEKCVKLHSKERYKQGAKGEKEPNPDYEFYQGYGNMEKLGAPPLLTPDRFVEVIMGKITEHARECVNAFNFQAEPKRKGDPMVVYDTVDDFLAMTKAAPDESDDDSDEQKDAEKQAWKATIEARLSSRKSSGLCPSLLLSLLLRSDCTVLLYARRCAVSTFAQLVLNRSHMDIPDTAINHAAMNPVRRHAELVRDIRARARARGGVDVP
jgi:hypothetical protein